jgi:hypothetical protein
VHRRFRHATGNTDGSRVRSAPKAIVIALAALRIRQNVVRFGDFLKGARGVHARHVGV